MTVQYATIPDIGGYPAEGIALEHDRRNYQACNRHQEEAHVETANGALVRIGEYCLIRGGTPGWAAP